jgi:hypothetical protein
MLLCYLLTILNRKIEAFVTMVYNKILVFLDIIHHPDII